MDYPGAIKRVVVKYYDKEEKKNKDLLIVGIIDEKEALVEGLYNSKELLDEHIKYAVEFSNIVRLNNKQLYKVEAVLESGRVASINLSFLSTKVACESVLSIVRRAESQAQMIKDGVKHWRAASKPDKTVPDIQVPVRSYHAVLITSSDELDEGVS